MVCSCGRVRSGEGERQLEVVGPAVAWLAVAPIGGVGSDAEDEDAQRHS